MMKKWPPMWWWIVFVVIPLAVAIASAAVNYYSR